MSGYALTAATKAAGAPSRLNLKAFESAASVLALICLVKMLCGNFARWKIAAFSTAC